MEVLEEDKTQRATAGHYNSHTDALSSTPVLRIDQLDALELDSALEQLLWTRFSRCFQHCRPGLLTPVEPELRVLLHLLLWRFTLYANSATVGQSMLNLRYHRVSSSNSRYRPLSSRQLLALALLTAGPRWLQERSHSLLPFFGLGSRGSTNEREEGFLQQGVRKALTFATGIVQLASLINFLVFLRNGRHPTLAERIVGTRVVFSKPNVTRNVSYLYMNRELLWHAFADFLVLVLPLINTRKLKATVSSLVLGKQNSNFERRKGAQDWWKECGLCGEWPTMPHTVGCHHVFCYYCIKSLGINELSLACPKCGGEAQPLEPLNVEVQTVGRELLQSSKD